MVIILLPIVAFFVLKNSKIQTYLTQKITTEVSKNLNAKIEIKSVNYKFFNKIVLGDVYIEDLQKDTLLYSKELICNIKNINTKTRLIDIKDIKLVNANLYLHKFDTLQSINITQLVRSARKKDTIQNDSPKWKVQFRNVRLRDLVFWYKSVRKTDAKYGIDFNDLKCYIDHLDVDNLTVNKGTVNFHARNLKFTEQSGFFVNRMKFFMSIGDKHMLFRNVKINTPQSYIVADSLCFYYNDYDDYDHFAENIRLDFGLQESNVNLKDIGYFAPVFRNTNLNVVVAGRAYSKLSTFKGENLRIYAGNQTEIMLDFNLNGLPDHREMFIFANFKKLTTEIKDFELFNKFVKKSEQIVIPDNLKKLGLINFKGNFAGFYDDFVTYGKFKTSLGNIYTDLALKPGESKKLNLKGSFKTKDFQLGELTRFEKTIGKIGMQASINGSIGSGKIKAKTEGSILNLEVNKYNYQNIEFDGLLTEKTYNGIFNITDPNFEMSFSGGIDFYQEIPEFNFMANIHKAKLCNLNIDTKDSTSLLKLDVSANFKGIDVDNIEGDLKFENASLRKFNEVMLFDTLNLISENIADTHRIELKSDYIDATLTGTYQSTTLIQSLKNLYFNYLSKLIRHPNDTTKIEFNNDFSLDVSLKNTDIISRFFILSLRVSDSSLFRFNYNADMQRFLLNANFNKLSYKHNSFDDLNINTYSNDSIFTIITQCSNLLLNNYFSLSGFNTTSIVNDNNVTLKLAWDNLDTVSYKGEVLVSAQINQKKAYGKPLFRIKLHPSEIIVQDSLWFVNKSILNIDSTSYELNDFFVGHGSQTLKADGKISSNPEDTLFVSLLNFDLANINVLTQKSKLEFGGVINGKANISNIYNNPLFYSDLSINNLVLNKEEFGFTEIRNVWDKEQKAIILNASTWVDKKETIKIEGKYYAENRNIDANISLKQLNTRVISPYLKSFASNLTGITSGNASIIGTFKRPVFNGDLYFRDAGMTIDYINTPYYFSTNAKIKNNSIVFKNTEIFDSYKNKGLVNGFVKFEPHKKLSFDFNINVENILALNTTGIHNDAFYGTAFMSGIVTIKGDYEDTYMDILGITEKNTKVNIPLTKFRDAKEYQFITFVNSKVPTKEKYRPEVSTTSNFHLNFDLEVTPDAHAQLVFDSKIGDILRGNGAGNLKMEIDDDNEFKMYGEYVLEKGDYLFTLQNVINKKFKLEQGGNIIWNGNPYDATLNLQAAYNLKTSLSGLVDSSYYNTSDNLKKRIPIQCQVFLTNKLMNPDIDFNINLPTADEEIRTLVRSVINTDEKKNKQFLSLLVLNSFLPEQDAGSNAGYSTNTSNLGAVTTSELLSNQLSHWLSQISDEWDIGINYRPSDEITEDQIEVALSTQLLNDRVSINGNVGYGGQAVDQTSNIVGDFNVDVKLNKSGKLRLKAFNESNDKLLYVNSPYTQGVGIFYREEFNSFSELLKIFNRRLRKNKKDAALK